jgi:hypothetical protein
MELTTNQQAIIDAVRAGVDIRFNPDRKAWVRSDTMQTVTHEVQYLRDNGIVYVNPFMRKVIQVN